MYILILIYLVKEMYLDILVLKSLVIILLY